ncbi:hypothetical protein SAMD00023353_5600640 [Rosellinia necatrix]|uniref:Uncharacterized protein n=1 Tax=Rosellinia necatrix TaxID=77044 RepID=A0A1S8AAF4_ROSNE|nr:hypothetical protein SAMD00023353_5600640 [Rosellinia necatrix]
MSNDLELDDCIGSLKCIDHANFSHLQRIDIVAIDGLVKSSRSWTMTTANDQEEGMLLGDLKSGFNSTR